MVFKEKCNLTLQQSEPFVSLHYDVLTITKEHKSLLPREKDEALNETEAKFIEKYMIENSPNINSPKYIQEIQKRIIVMLMINYGLGFTRIKNAKCKNYNFETKQIEVSYMPNIHSIKLKDEIMTETEEYLVKRFGTYDVNLHGEELLFQTKNSMEIKNNFAGTYLKKIQKKYCATYNLDTIFTPTGVVKYALVQLISSNVDMFTIGRLTDNGETILKDCYNIYFEIREDYDLNSHINEQYNLSENNR